MAERIRIITDCDVLRSPNPQGDRLARLGAGSDLPLLRDEDAGYYKVAYGGQPVFVAKSHCVKLEADTGGGAAGTVVPPTGQTVAMRPAPAVRRRHGNGSLTILRVLALIIGLGMAAAGVGMIIAPGFAVVLTDTSVDLGYTIGIIGGALLAGGLLLIRLAFRPLLQLALILGGIALAIGGAELLLFAIPLSRMSGGDIDTDRAGTALPIAGGILLGLGIAMALVAALRWLGNPESRARWPEVARWAAIIYGGLLVLGTGAPTYTPATEQGYTPTLQDAAIIGAAIPLFLLPGAVLGYHGLTMFSHRQERAFRFLPAAWLAALFVFVVALGVVVVAVEEPLVWLMSGAHAAAALLPALVLVALVSRGGLRLGAPLAGMTHRHVWVGLAVGAVVVTIVAGTLDGVIAEILGMALLAADGAFDGLRTFDEVAEVLVDADLYLSRGYELAFLLIVVVVMAPIMEEGFKAIGVALVLPRRATPGVALALGVAVGAGFGVFEASVYGLGGLEADSDIDWWALMLVRGGATSMHALNTGLLGLALYYDQSQGRLRRAIMLYAAAVALHGLWNGLAVLAGSRVILSFEGLSDQALAWLVFAVMGALGLAVIGTLYAVARRAYSVSAKVGDAEEAATPPAPLPTLEPWLG